MLPHYIYISILIIKEFLVMNKNEQSVENLTVSIELVVPAYEFDTIEFAERFHNQFAGNPDYIKSNIVVHDDGKSHTGAAIFIKDVEDYDRMKKELMKAIDDVFSHIESKNEKE
jgi:hypothetical protein